VVRFDHGMARPRVAAGNRSFLTSTGGHNSIPVHSFTQYFFEIYFSIIFPSSSRSANLSLIQALRLKCFIYISHLPMHAVYPAHLIILGLVTVILLDEV